MGKKWMMFSINIWRLENHLRKRMGGWTHKPHSAPSCTDVGYIILRVRHEDSAQTATPPDTHLHTHTHTVFFQGVGPTPILAAALWLIMRVGVKGPAGGQVNEFTTITAKKQMTQMRQKPEWKVTGFWMWRVTDQWWLQWRWSSGRGPTWTYQCSAGTRGADGCCGDRVQIELQGPNST